MIRAQLLLALLDAITAILTVGILVTGYFACDGPRIVQSLRGYGFNDIKGIFLTPMRRRRCLPHSDGGLPHTDCIRLVMVESKDGGLALSSHVFPLSSAPAYRALSYTWGHAYGLAEDEDPVFHFENGDGTSESMPKNLYRALFRIIELDEGMYYWIDFLCIDQKNPRERSQQVSIMKDIYERAEAVDVWLGPAADSEATTMKRVLADLSAMASEYGTTWTTKESQSRSFFIHHPEHLLPREDWETLAIFMSRRWFHRLWTLQEFAVARKVRILYGSHFIKHDELHSAALFLHSLGLPMKLQYGSNLTAGAAVMQQSILRECLIDMNQLKKLVSKVSGTDGDDNQMPDYESVLAWVFWRSAATYATDPRDLVYGILGLAQAVMERLHNVASDTDSRVSSHRPILPDYSLSTASVFRAFILRLLHGKMGIRAITLVTPGVQKGDKPQDWGQRRVVPSWVDDKHELPSWVPNLATREQFPLSCSGAFIPIDTGVGFNVHGFRSLARTQRFHINGNNLHVFGRRLGISNTSSRFPSSLDWAPCQTFVLNLFRPLASLPLHYPTRCTDTGTSRQSLSPFETLFSCLSLGSWYSKPRIGSFSGPVLPVWRFERFIADIISAYLCIKLSSTSSNVSVDHILVEDAESLLSRAQSIRGMNKTYLEDAYKRWRMPQRIFNRHDLIGCLEAFDAGTLFSSTCSRLIQQFPQATGRRVFVMDLDENYTSRLCVYSEFGNQQEAAKILLGLGPEAMSPKDEIWAIKGSEWPFVLRPLYHDDGGKLPVMDKPFDDKAGGWWRRTEKGARPIKVFQLIGEAYVHGIMRGELFNEQALTDFEEIIIR